jgi:hypothetical protein
MTDLISSKAKAVVVSAVILILVSCVNPLTHQWVTPTPPPVPATGLPMQFHGTPIVDTGQVLQSSPTDPLYAWKQYKNPYFKVSLLYPPDWEHQDGEPAYGDRFGNQQGFFTITAMGGPGLTLDQAARSEAQHKLQPYGPNPLIETLEIHGQEARLIIPGVDESDNMRWQAGLIVRYPTPLWLNGNEYPYLVLYSDPAHIHQLAQTIQFNSISYP